MLLATNLFSRSTCIMTITGTSSLNCRVFFLQGKELIKKKDHLIEKVLPCKPCYILVNETKIQLHLKTQWLVGMRGSHMIV